MQKIPRRRHRLLTPSQNLDSFLDIMTNTVGVLMFVSLFISLVAVSSGTTIRTPLVTQTKKHPFLFEIKDNQVRYIDVGTAQAEINRFINSLPTCEKPPEPYGNSADELDFYFEQVYQYRLCLGGQLEELKNFSAETDYYKVQLVDLESFAWEYQPKPNIKGESAGEIADADSKFRDILQKIDPSQSYLAFIVRPDSFSAFRSARKIAWEQGFNVGWEPMNADTAIVLGAEGRSIGVQ